MNPLFKRVISLIAMAAVLGSNTSLAQTGRDQDSSAEDEGPLEEVVVTATRFIGETGQSALKSDVPLRDVPLTVSSYTGEFMEALETLRVSDLYDYMVGVQRAGNTAYDVTIRGFASGGADRNTLMVDGLPGQAVRFGSPPTINAERIEVVKGPASVLYGQVQPGGFINIVSKKPQAEPMTVLRLRSESFYGDEADTGDSLGFTASLDSTGALSQDDTFLYRVVAELGDTPGFRDFGRGDSTYLVPSLTWNPGEDTTLTAFVEYRKETVFWDDGLVAPNNAAGVPDVSLVNQDITTYYHEPGDTNREEGVTAGLNFSHLINDNLEWRGNFRGVDHEDARLALDFRGTRTCHPSSVAGQLDPTGICVRRRQRDQLNKRTYYFGDTNLVWELERGNTSHNLMFGINAGEETANFKRNDFGTSNDTYDISLYNPRYGQGTPNPPQEHSWALTTYDSFAVYVQDMISVGEQWKILLAARYEEFDILNESKRPPDHPRWSEPRTTKGDAIVPMAGVVFQPTEQTSYYVSYAESFNPPAPGRVDINGNIFEVPEEGLQYEAGVKADLFDNRGTVTFSVFHIEKKNSLQQIGTTGIFQLTGVEESEGFEVEVDAAINERWQLLAGLAYADAVVTDDVDPAIIGQQLRNTPEWTASLWNRYEINDAFSLGLGINYVDDRFGTIPDEDGEDARLALPSYTVVDAAVYYTNEQYRLNATLKLSNLLDEKYYPSAFSPTRVNPGAPAGITLSVTKAF